MRLRIFPFLMWLYSFNTRRLVGQCPSAISPAGTNKQLFEIQAYHPSLRATSI